MARRVGRRQGKGKRSGLIVLDARPWLNRQLDERGVLPFWRGG